MIEKTSYKPGMQTFIPEFEGLRGLLAAWVVFGHILLFSGFTYQDGWFGIVFSPVLGVYAFMMLSGFVIFAALDQRPTNWFQFMSRRFWRLFPVYTLCMLLAILLFNVSVNISNSAALATFGSENLERLNDVNQNFEIYLLADATLLQCLLPRNWFPYAHESFLPPTWSLTIEWLFYMVAPALLLILNRWRKPALYSLGALVALVYLSDSWITENWNRSFHVGNVLYFLTGIASYYVWKHLPQRKTCMATKLVFWGLVIGGIALLSLPYKIWFATMALILYDRVHARSLEIIELPRRVLNSQPLQFLGRTSYVTYLLHWIIIEVVLFWLFQVVPEISGRFLLATICTVAVYPLTYLCAHLIHKYLEVPCIRFGKRQKSNSLFEPLPSSQATAQ